MSSILETNRLNRLMARPPFAAQDQTRSYYAPSEDWSGAELLTPLQAREIDPRAFLVNGTGAICFLVPLQRHPVVTSSRSSLWCGDFGTCAQNSLLSLLMECVSRLIRPESTRAAISTIKFNFSLNMSQLAEVLGVARPTVYAWLDEEAGVCIQQPHQRRIEQLASYAELWWDRAQRPFPQELLGSALGSMLLNLFKAEVLNDHLIRKVIEALCTGLPAKRKLVTVKGVGPIPSDESLTIEELTD